MLRVLVADSNLYSHELIQDIVHINFRNVTVERAHNYKSFVTKIENAEPQYNLILYSMQMENESGQNALCDVIKNNPEIEDRMILMADSQNTALPESLDRLPTVSKPYSLDYFGEVIKKTCVN